MKLLHDLHSIRQVSKCKVDIAFRLIDQSTATISAGGVLTDNFPHGFDPTASVLFLGAGFSFDATNVNGSSPPTVDKLEGAIKRLCELPDDDPSSLADLSRYAVQQGKDLFGLLSNLYSIKSLSSDQREILGHPWLRIYTTNYDDCVEQFWSNEGIRWKGRSFSLDETPPTQIRTGSMVHLHGYIHKCTRENILGELVLSHHSYAQQRAITSPWWDIFERDIRVARNIFFVGYQLNDFEPASYLTKNPSLTNKTHFVLRPSKSPVIEARLSEYGIRHPIEVSGFAEECRQAKVQERLEHPNSLSAFRFTDLLKDDKIAVQPTQIEVQALFAFGNFKFQRLLATYPDPKYVAPRNDSVDECIDKLQNNKTVIIHSKVGNGKSIFRNALAIALSTKNYACFEMRENVTPPEAELAFLRRTDKVVVFFPDYETAYTNIHLFTELKDSARFIIEMNTGTLQVRRTEAYDRLHRPIERVDLNILAATDCADVYQILDEAGIAPADFGQRFVKSVEFRDIVLSIFENPSVAARIDQAVGPLLKNANAKLVLLCSAILKALGVNTDPGFLRAISNVDAFDVLTKAGEGAFEFVDFSHDRVEPHSALFSEFLIRKYLEPHELAGAVFRMASEAARRMNEEPGTQSERARAARATLGGLLRFSFLNDMLKNRSDRTTHIQDVYEHGRRDVYIQGEPLFWLQYSIFMQDVGRWDLAEKHLETAYQRGAARPGFLTFQLDTNYLGLCLDLEISKSAGDPVTRAETILTLLDRARSMVQDGNHRGHVLKVLEELEPMLKKRKSGLSIAEKTAFTYKVNLLISDLESLSAQDKALWGSEAVKLSLQRSVATLLE